MCPFSLTADGHEMQWGTNHLGHYQLVQALLPVLKATGSSSSAGGQQPARVVVLSSAAHFGPYPVAKGGPIRFDALDSEEGYNAQHAYVSGCGLCLCVGAGWRAFGRTLAPPSNHVATAYLQVCASSRPPSVRRPHWLECCCPATMCMLVLTPTNSLQPLLKYAAISTPKHTSTHLQGQSKLMNVLFMRELHKRLAAEGAPVVAVACHPGEETASWLGVSMLDRWLRWHVLYCTLSDRSRDSLFAPACSLCWSCDISTATFLLRYLCVCSLCPTSLTLSTGVIMTELGRHVQKTLNPVMRVALLAMLSWAFKSIPQASPHSASCWPGRHAVGCQLANLCTL